MSIFPHSERVIYARNTLARVICQVRFPAILRISAEAPADFQDAVRDSFPLFGTKTRQNLPHTLPPEFASLLAGNPTVSDSAYDFTSNDGEWKLSLSKEFLALTTTRYTRWEDFRGRLRGPLDALEKVYKPAFFDRVGLRYLNVIDPAKLELQTKWGDLIKPHILGVLSDEQICGRVEGCGQDVLISIGEQSAVKLQHGLGINEEKSGIVYLIDADYFTTQRLEVDNATQKLDEFNQESGKLFRWCITDQLHTAMEPKPAD
ncbi:TIGR04255 family protein [Pirellulales bacterium]|nr:TIGR04255 family protein [Pirellulales bacterium]